MMHTKHLKNVLSGLAALLVSMLLTAPVAAGFFGSEELEKPTPEFSREGDTIVAKLIPRAKSTSVQIFFEVDGARLVDVTGIDFFEADRPEVDVKNFKSSLFEVAMDNLSSGEKVKVRIFSDFFTSSTQFYIFNENKSPAWSDAGAQNRARSERVQEIVIDVKDGGPFDSDGKVNGKIKLVGGPRDSFWGYALGTLFIRFFGIFLVLIVLMIGMIVSGRIFHRMQQEDSPSRGSGTPGTDGKTAPETGTAPSASASGAGGISPEAAAAVATALHLHFSLQKNRMAAFHVTRGISASWTSSGRSQIMNDRLMMYNR